MIIAWMTIISILGFVFTVFLWVIDSELKHENYLKWKEFVINSISDKQYLPYDP